MAQKESSSYKSETATPGDYPVGGKPIWMNLLSQFFGDEEANTPGLINLLQQGAKRISGGILMTITAILCPRRISSLGT